MMNEISVKSNRKGLLGGLIFAIIPILCWFLISFNGIVGYYSAPLFGILIPLGIRLFSKQPLYNMSVVLSTVIITISVLISAYLGYLINTYIGFYPLEITFSEMNAFIKECWVRNEEGFRKAVILEIGIGLVASYIFEVLTVTFLKRKQGEK